MERLTVTDFAPRFKAGRACLLDVREPWEVETAAIEGALTIPMNDVPERLEEIRAARAGRDLVVMCHSGQRSAVIARFLNQSGFDGVFNLEGGIEAWSRQIDPDIPTY